MYLLTMNITRKERNMGTNNNPIPNPNDIDLDYFNIKGTQVG